MTDYELIERIKELEYKYFVVELCFQVTDDEEMQDVYFEEMYQIGERLDHYLREARKLSLVI